MLLLLHNIVTYSKENIITKIIQPAKKTRASTKSPTLFVKKPLCMGDLLPVHKIFIERPLYIYIYIYITAAKRVRKHQKSIIVKLYYTPKLNHVIYIYTNFQVKC